MKIKPVEFLRRVRVVRGEEISSTEPVLVVCGRPPCYVPGKEVPCARCEKTVCFSNTSPQHGVPICGECYMKETQGQLPGEILATEGSVKEWFDLLTGGDQQVH